MYPFKRLYQWRNLKDFENGKVALIKSENGNQIPKVNYSEDGDDFVDSVDTTVKYADGGNLSCSVEAILALAHCLKNRWPIPDSLAEHMSDKLLDATITFGQTGGKVDARYRSFAKALGLSRPKGKPQDPYRDFFIHCYMKNRIELYDESKYAAAKHAEKAFKGSEFSTKHDNLEAIFDRYEKENGGSYEYTEALLFLLAGPEFCPIGMVYNDIDFLKDTIPYLGDDPSKFREDTARYIMDRIQQQVD